MDSKKLLDEILKQLQGVKPTEQSKGIMIKVTPRELLNIGKRCAKYWETAKINKTTKSIDEVCLHHVELAISILEKTDPDRFEYNN